MKRDPKAYLWDVKQACLDIRTFVGDMRLDDYTGSPLVRAAVERKFEIIGEALNGLTKAAPDIASKMAIFDTLSPSEIY